MNYIILTVENEPLEKMRITIMTAAEEAAASKVSFYESDALYRAAVDANIAAGTAGKRNTIAPDGLECTTYPGKVLAVWASEYQGKPAGTRATCVLDNGIEVHASTANLPTDRLKAIAPADSVSIQVYKNELDTSVNKRNLCKVI